MMNDQIKDQYWHDVAPVKYIPALKRSPTVYYFVNCIGNMQKWWLVKVMERIIHEQIEEYISSHDILYYIQLGVGWVITDTYFYIMVFCCLHSEPLVAVKKPTNEFDHI